MNELQVVRMKVAELHLDPANARKHSERNLAAIKASLARFGQQKPIVVDADGIVRAGNGTLVAAQALGWEEIDAVRTGLRGSEATAFAIADNRTADLAEWDNDVLAEQLKALRAEGLQLTEIGFKSDEFKQLLAMRGVEEHPPSKEDEIDVLVKPGELWILGEHRLMCGDSTNAEQVRKLLGGGAPNLMATDPPYGVDYKPEWRDGIGVAGGTSLGRVENDTVVDWTAAFKLFAGAVAYVWHAGVFAAEVANSLKLSDFALRAQIIWNKQIAPISRGHYHWKHEPCWYAVRNGKTANWNGARDQNTVWDMNAAIGFMSSGEAEDARTGHSTQKPVEAWRRPMLNHTKLGEWIYEPFCGSGTAVIAAEALERRCAAMELSPKYCQVIINRWEKYAGSKAKLAEE